MISQLYIVVRRMLQLHFTVHMYFINVLLSYVGCHNWAGSLHRSWRGKRPSFFCGKGSAYSSVAGKHFRRFAQRRSRVQKTDARGSIEVKVNSKRGEPSTGWFKYYPMPHSFQNFSQPLLTFLKSEFLNLILCELLSVF
jgi:hypothetical protein